VIFMRETMVTRRCDVCMAVDGVETWELGPKEDDERSRIVDLCPEHLAPLREVYDLGRERGRITDHVPVEADPNILPNDLRATLGL
jgi:hypothetical protein